MRGLRKLLVVLLLLPAVSFADDTTTGVAVSSLETKLGDFLLGKSVQDFGFSIYQQGRSYGEVISSSPDMDFVNKHAQAYCSTQILAESAGFKCTPLSGISPADAKYLELGDISFSTLLEPTVYSTTVDIAAQNLIRNVINPFPDTKYKNYVTSTGFLDNGTKKAEYAKYMAAQASLGVALYSMNEMYGMRVSGASLGVTSTPAKTSSILSIMETEATRRFEGDTAFADLLTNPATDQLSLMKEMAAMQAFQMWLDYHKFRQNERIEALLAATLAKTVTSASKMDALLSKVGQ